MTSQVDLLRKKLYHDCKPPVKILKKSCLTSKINSIFYVKSIEFLITGITFLVVFDCVSFKSFKLNTIHDVKPQLFVIFTL